MGCCVNTVPILTRRIGKSWSTHRAFGSLSQCPTVKRHWIESTRSFSVTQDGKGQSKGRETKPILQLKQGKERCDEQTKEQNCILIKKLLRIMYFLCKQKIVHFSNFDEVVHLMVENGDDEVRKHLDIAPRNANYGSHVAISKYLDAISLWVQQGILRSLKEAAFYSILADESTDIGTIEELSICLRLVDSSGSPVDHFLGLVSFLLVMQLQHLLHWKLF